MFEFGISFWIVWSSTADVQVDAERVRRLYITDDSLLSFNSECPAYIIVSAGSDAYLSDNVCSSLSTHAVKFTDIYCNQC